MAPLQLQQLVTLACNGKLVDLAPRVILSSPSALRCQRPQTAARSMQSHVAFALVDATEAQQQEQGILTRIKSEKALKALGLAAGGSGQVYMPVHPEDLDHLATLEWVQELLDQPNVKTILSCGAMSEANASVDPDHLFLSLLKQDLVRDIMFLWDSSKETFHTLLSIGSDVCGHGGIVHGGFTSAVIDETTGGLVYELKKAGQLGEGPAFTAHLEVDYKKPLPAVSDVVCSAWVEKVEGRKCYTVAEVRDRPGGEIYAVGRALYVTPRQQPVDSKGALKATAAAS